MLQPKDTGLLNGYKNKTHIYAVYKRPNFRPRDTYRLKVRGWKNQLNRSFALFGTLIMISNEDQLFK